MSSKVPPTPEANRSDKGSGETSHADNDGRLVAAAKNPDKVGQQGNSKVNTTHQGYQQDR
ncbi:MULTISPECIES: hypothetical protein [Rhizobium]|jgi:hypothetical protein|uniref:Uncharacterized protein n=1 Tax=Rhizobium leguminosarum bv. trifolii (strain WSM1325) TaxID=395491 RepID=C6B837_RHILS|nr:hypothetical protein [Rhizobium leguminosarum]ACS60569.1 conserved hypothetical protein [Rhizobium leguminosarum bv. trifolii WSM1325]MBY2910133.1 hypothetical protein [Rhizobium leguminosarum]MBY2917708.1 hypothetical protein [Rhizobium leguminosarum]MBY2925359.1 hypothetical protein [Rhizobium leguminosarum]MBY2936279.1 hypothetical protein [Rhizobium leguminosarum]